MAQGRPLRAKVLIEGIEVPFIGATITSTVNQASIAYLDLVPHQTINDIKPRSLVQLFVRDFQDTAVGKEGQAAFPYILAWEGEVFGYTFGKTASSRSFSISCIDTSSYWDNVLSYFFNAQQSLGKATNEITGQARDITDSKKQGIKVQPVAPAQASYYRLKLGDVLKDPKKDFLDGFIALYKDFVLVNDFYNNAEERLRILDRIRLHSSGKLQTLIEQGEALNWFTGIVGRTSGYVSLRMVIQDLMSLIFHDMLTVPFPARVRGDAKPPLAGVEKDPKTIGTFIAKPNLYMMPPPMCNIFFPDEYSSFQFSRNFFEEPTRLIYTPELPARLGTDSTRVVLPHLYEPPSFENYMQGDKPNKAFQGDDGTQIPLNRDPGKNKDKDTSAAAKVDNGVKTEAQFLTNEELYKGIWTARESMMPANSQFRAALDDHGKSPFTRRVARYLFFKKRFQKRQLQITSHLKLSVVPGFPVLILDGSDADQTVTAYCSSVTHRIYATEGGFTNTTLSYARTVAEQDISSEFGTQILIPPWFDDAIFGTVGQPPPSAAAPQEVAAAGVTIVSTEKISDFYATLLGSKGSKALTNFFAGELTLLGAARKLRQEYDKQKALPGADILGYLASLTARDYVKMRDAMSFIKATTTETNLEDTDFLEFTGPEFLRKGKLDESVITLKRNVIVKYRDILKAQRGFRG
ncbi:MAG: hypothetical protein MUP21_07015 [Dehalococcoidia bacterium]|nr:hypothetical protein [Dehalococcoidia bacterium]